ncbi:hypothetical protein QN277_028547 [Acacia crassicarpa]|uniref:Uncharacterized protein n=1 Tax=Acacia crassicarpa TaxID=499986 RepID=A0AAE1J515_9FABA|nr:hypothetical protein QN277_028547 [Acacia crassicarpa]
MGKFAESCCSPDASQISGITTEDGKLRRGAASDSARPRCGSRRLSRRLGPATAICSSSNKMHKTKLR